MADLATFLRACSDALVAGATTPVIADGARRFAAAVDAATADTALTLPEKPSWLPVLDTLAALPKNELSQMLVGIAPELAWTPTHRRDENGLLDGGEDIALCRLDEVLAADDVSAGISFLGPQRKYPVHHHPPQEIYLIIGGTAEWRYGGARDYVSLDPGQVIYNHPHDEHAMITDAEALLALWVLY